MKVILPWRKNPIPTDTAFYFLAGPGQGGGDWQRIACEELFKIDPDCTVAIPHRYEDGHVLATYFYEDCSVDSYLGQTHWERYYLEMAANHPKGAIIFWLQTESLNNPRTDGLPYAIQTYGELGEWRGRMMNSARKNLVVGASMGFPGLKHIQQNFNLAFQSSYPNGFLICSSLEETARHAHDLTV